MSVIFTYSSLFFFFLCSSALSNSDRCQYRDDRCTQTDGCCSTLICSFIAGQGFCISAEQVVQRSIDNYVIPPYYHSKNVFHLYGHQWTPFPFRHAYEEKLSKFHPRNKLEWDHCRFHEDCGEGNCCYVHFRFRSLPKSFCRPNRNLLSDLCEPLTRYRSLKDVPTWKEQQQKSTSSARPNLSI